MPVLTYAQMEGYAIKAGWPRSEAPIVAAIGEAESGGNTDAVNPRDNNGRQSSFGWLQISNGTHSPPSPNWADPATNAALGYAKYKAAGDKFTDWGTYDSGAYRSYVQGSTTPDMNVTGSPTATASEDAASTKADCLIGISGVPGTSWVNDLFGSGGNVGQVCFVSRSEARGFIGALLLGAGAAAFGLTLGLMLYVAGQRTALGGAAAGFVQRRAGGQIEQAEAQQRDQGRQQQAQQRAAAAQQRAADRAQAAQQREALRASQTPRGRHASASPRNQFAGRHARPGPRGDADLARPPK